MGLQPKIQPQSYPFTTRVCTYCGKEKRNTEYSKTKSILAPDSYASICNECLERLAADGWETVDLLCQQFNIPFIPKEYEKIKELNPTKPFQTYNTIFFEAEYSSIDWKRYYEDFKELEEAGFIEDELPKIREEKFRKLRDKWGANYDDEDLSYLEGLYNGLLTTQNVNGALQIDQAKKLCKISLEIDQRIRGGGDFDKILSSYDKLVKVAEFTPKNAKNVSDFDSTGEIVLWLEKRGWKNKFYDNVTRDIVDESLKNIQAANQRFYTNESGIGDDITQRLKSLERAQETESYYETDEEYDLEQYQDQGWSEINDEGDFNPDV